ncbi:hypothetical protein EVAR_52404_1 [Eumeta japonica]|uniref:Mariner Mos1 transposase n=1 Tax=Eumeta variegata TaxID=151549 RepID=A0A4C1Z622_EUMVA|nr:hypothetical protein EVAR_52404_1 [Eumeta japonica]
MLCVWRDWKEGRIHYELLPPGKTVNSDLYCQHLMSMERKKKKTKDANTPPAVGAASGRRRQRVAGRYDLACGRGPL